jgi:CheY-like chemotaxis protein
LRNSRLRVRRMKTPQFALGHHFGDVSGGPEAIDYLDLLKSEIELVIIAVELPVVSGLEIVWRLVRQDQPKPTKIIVTSAVDFPLLKQVVEELGVAAVVRTPIPLQKWRKTIEAVLGKELHSSSQISN